MDFLFAGEVKNGKLKLDDITGFKRYLIGLEDKKIQVIVRKYKTSRSNEQNRYYWGVVVKILADSFGYDPEEMHEALKWEFLKKKGVKIPTVISTTKLTTTQFQNYVEKVQRWASVEHGIIIPDPHEVLV